MDERERAAIAQILKNVSEWAAQAEQSVRDDNLAGASFPLAMARANLAGLEHIDAIPRWTHDGGDDE
jgi:hypothetical protein